MSSATFYPDADPETSSVDGRTQRYVAAGDTWGNIRDLSGSAAYDAENTSAPIVLVYSDDETNKWRQIIRSLFLFDTSSLPDDAIITGATLSIYGTADTIDKAGWLPNINIYASIPASNIALVAADYVQIGSTPLCDTPITYANWNTVGYNDFILNAAGLAAISKTGVTKFSARNANYDVGNSAPAWANAQYSGLYGYFSEKGEGYRPKLVITYTIPATYELSISDSLKVGDSRSVNLIANILRIEGMEFADEIIAEIIAELHIKKPKVTACYHHQSLPQDKYHHHSE